ncbi:MAG TPA: APC family permease [Candidatus Dormibacteraeota bacterium]|nr:APC family permease [Candidatus Dormibacteraeota bacterium]HVC23905.1 APC family permease [Candidatus Dormibacteraeota bacterium]
MSSGQDSLKALGYEQELHRSVSPLGHISLILSDITPTASLLVIATAVVAVAGMGSPIAFVIGCFIAINVAFCMGELGSMFPVAGGLFSIVTRVLGRPAGFVAMIDYMGQAVFLPASVAIGIGTYVHSLAPSIPENVIAGVGMIVVTGVCLLQIRFNSWLTALFLAIELLVVSAIALAGFTHLHQPLSILTHPTALGSHGLIGPIAASAIIAAVATSLFSVNGYDSGINFAEEVLGSAKEVGRAVVTAALVGIVFELVPFVAIVFAAPSVSAFLHSGTPLTYVAGTAFGSNFKTIITVGGLLAIFNASVAITLQFARIVWASGRDVAWPQPISSWIGKVDSRRGAPWVATLVVGVLATILCFQSTLITVVTFTAVLLIILYGLIAISALVSRVQQRNLPRPSKMPLWPLPPVIALVGVVLALTQQKVSDLITVAVLFGVALVYYYGFVARRPGRYWIQADLPEPYDTNRPLPSSE